MALESENADDRRRGVIGLAESSDGDADWAMKVYDTIARTDRDPSVRCAAVHALGERPDATRAAAALGLLASPEARAETIRPAPPSVRWEAAKLLQRIVQDSAYDSSQRPDIVRTLLDRLARDRDRNVRLTAIETLVYFPEPPVAHALVDVLAEEDDYALQHAAEMSLVALTGRTFNGDPRAWRQWLSESEDAFANAGAMPEELRVEKSPPVWEWPW